MKKPKTTLFMLMSIDGKISTGSSDERDFDKDLKNIKYVKDGLYQYYELEQKTDEYSLNTGRVMSKIGINERDIFPDEFKEFMNFIIIDNSHLKLSGLENLSNKLKKLFLVTTNKEHPVFNLDKKNIEVIVYDNEIDFNDLFFKLYNKYKIENLTIQSGGTLNSILLRNDLIDYLSIVVAPILVGGKNTPTLIDGNNIINDIDLKNIKTCDLEAVKVLKNSYLHLNYKIIKK